MSEAGASAYPKGQWRRAGGVRARGLAGGGAVGRCQAPRAQSGAPPLPGQRSGLVVPLPPQRPKSKQTRAAA